MKERVHVESVLAPVNALHGGTALTFAQSARFRAGKRRLTVGARRRQLFYMNGPKCVVPLHVTDITCGAFRNSNVQNCEFASFIARLVKKNIGQVKLYGGKYFNCKREIFKGTMALI